MQVNSTVEKRKLVGLTTQERKHGSSITFPLFQTPVHNSSSAKYSIAPFIKKIGEIKPPPTLQKGLA